MFDIPEKYKNLKKVYVDTTHVATQIDSPKVYYKIKPNEGYVVCGYCNICFILKEDADLDTDRVFFYNERQSKLEHQSN
ncbi:MAG: zinc-finger domain-containing protein [alpha proteobacterium HIMB114]|nr:MAG: zinc-finger domain-containing protein [alpha proteobacterium HIMB114]